MQSGDVLIICKTINFIDTRIYRVSRETELARLVPITQWGCKASLHRRITTMSFGTSGYSVTSQMVGYSLLQPTNYVAIDCDCL